MIIWLSSYPRSGNTFIRTLLKNCLGQCTHSIYNDDEIDGDPGLSEITGHKNLKYRFGTPEFDLSGLRDDDQLYFIKTHEPNRGLLCARDRVIYIIRDGREATLSFHKYLLDFYNTKITPLELTLGLEFPGGSWSDHVAGWSPIEQEDTLLLRFEEVISDPRKALDLIAEFTGIERVKYQIPDFNELQNINSRFFRKGERDSFKNEVSDEAQALFWLRSFREMQRYGYLDASPRFMQQIGKGDLETIEAAMQKGVQYARSLNSKLNSRLMQLTDFNNKLEGQVKELMNIINSDETYPQETKDQLNQKRELLITVNDLTLRLEEREGEVTKLHVCNEKRQQQLDLYINRIKELSENIDIQRNDIEMKMKMIRKQQSELDRLAAAIDIMKNSLSWRLTSPFRFLMQFISNVGIR